MIEWFLDFEKCISTKKKWVTKYRLLIFVYNTS